MRNFRPAYLSLDFFKISSTKLLIELRNWRLILASLTFAYLVLFILVWLSNLDLMWFLLTEAGLSGWQSLILDTPEILMTNYQPLQAALIVIFAVLQGLNISLFIKAQRSKQAIGSGLASGVVAVGVGCGACGTSMLTPLVASLGLGSVGMVETIGVVLITAGIVVTVYSIHRLLLMTTE